MSKPTDVEFAKLLSAARQGSSEAWGGLLERYRGYLTFLAWRQSDPHLRRKVSDSDLVQETFLRAVRYQGSFEGTSEEQLLHWLRAILASRLAERFETQGRLGREVELQQVLSESSQSLVKSLVSPDDTPRTRAQSLEMEVRLADALTTLPVHYREAVVLRHMEGQSLAEIVQRTGWSTDQVQKYIQRGLKRLAMLLASDSSD